ncbi:unnamed protein product [Sphenostylis stenocarpa]|uniref:Exocyst subunit Exo70 family protein n=1 Tax=Sphenostylis stenocarpa TaxID=92480 RepID=A0AA86VU64_9FABA|nr:unnamed protein product [Sphenostylis stenocarpa]
MKGLYRDVPQADPPQTIIIGTGNTCPQPVIDLVWPSRGTTRSASQIVSPQERAGVAAPPENIDSPMACFMDCIEALKKENGSVISTISRHVDKYLKANVLSEDRISVPKLHGDDNIMVDSLSSGIIILRERAKNMVLDGFQKECLDVYSNWRRDFLKESLLTLGLQDQEFNMEDNNNMEKIEKLIKAMNVAARILFPNERRLCDLVFGGSIWKFHFREFCTDLATSLLNSALALPTWSHFMRNTLQELIQEFQSYTTLVNSTVFVVRQRLCLQETLEDVTLIPCGGLHPITLEVMYYLYSDYKNKEISTLSQALEEGKISSTVYMARVAELLKSSLEAKSKNANKFELMYYIYSLRRSRESKLSQGLEQEKFFSPECKARTLELLESSLEANSKNYNNPTLGYVFIMNNLRFITVETKLNGLEPIFGDDWLQKNTTKFQQNLELYQRSSWNKIVDFLKPDINQLEPSVAAELMKDNLHWFSEHFDETCNVQSAWSICDEELREQIIKSIENILLPAYGNFLRRFEELIGKHAYEYIQYGMFEVQDRLNRLFLVRE